MDNVTTSSETKHNKKEKKKKVPSITVLEEAPVFSSPSIKEEKEHKKATTPKPSKKTLSLGDVEVVRFNPDLDKGLSNDDYESRRMAGLFNKLDNGSTKNIPSILFKNIFTFYNLLILGLAGWLLSVQASTGNFVFVVIMGLNVLIGIIQEIKAKATIDKLSLLAAPVALVIRNGIEEEISTEDIVIDDLLILTSGKQIPVDAVIRSGMIEVNESLLTGETDPIIKKEGDSIYSGSYVVSGKAIVQVVAIGKDIYIEKLTHQAKKYTKPKSVLFRSLNIIIKTVGSVVLPLGGLLFYYQYTSGVIYKDAVLGTSAAMIGMIPTGLFLLTSVSLYVGVIKLSQRNALVQELSCIEMLARIDTLCLDKTGTITDGTMSVKGVIEYKTVSGLTTKNIVSMLLNSLSDPNMTTAALIERFGTGKKVKHKAMIPFSSTRKLSAVTYEKLGTFVLGAPEFVLRNNYQVIAGDVEREAQKGYRVLCLAHTNEEINNETLTGNLEPLALIIIEDNIRIDAIDTINYFKEIGVNIKVISGDNPVTVSRIASRAGIENASAYISLDEMSDKDIIRVANQYNVFGRVGPSQKKVLIKALKSEGHVVAMTGDGVNDILALKEADTSIAMASGAEAARNVSHLVLLDSSFASMPKVVSEGRRVINNIQKVSAIFLTKTIFSLLLLIWALISKNHKYPIQPSQLALIDFLVSGIPSFVLALQPNDKIVKGRFVSNVVKSALPGAIVVLINCIIISVLSRLPSLEMNDSVISTLVVLSATVTTFCVLFNVSKPFNTAKKILVFTMATLFVSFVVLLPYIFDFNPFFSMIDWNIHYDREPLTIPQILLLLCICEASFALIWIISKIPAFFKAAFKWIIRKLANTN